MTRYRGYDELLAYCRYSANPVGHLVLHLCGYTDEGRRGLSDFTCTALQLANFWQDVARDRAIAASTFRSNAWNLTTIQSKCSMRICGKAGLVPSSGR